jgi:ribosome biogenesis protein Nip4
LANTKKTMKRLKYFFIKTIAFGFNLDFWVWLSFTQSVIEGSKNRFLISTTLNWLTQMCVLRQCNYLPAAAKCVWVSVKQQKIEREKQKNRKIYKKDRKVCVCVGNRVRKRHLSGFIDNSSKKNYVILRGEKKYFLSQNVFFVVVVVKEPIFKIHWKRFGWNR